MGEQGIQHIQNTHNSATPLWRPTEEWKCQSELARFIDFVNVQYAPIESPNAKFSIDNYEALHSWSVRNQEAFWHALWKFFPIIAHSEPKIIKKAATELWHTKWFEGAKLNFAENLLCANNSNGEHNNTSAIQFVSELGEVRTLRYSDLYHEVAKLSHALVHFGIQAGDVIAGYLPNIPETIIAMLACTALGAVWSSCSCDFGEKGVEDRFLQIAPKVLFTVDSYSYRGKVIDTLQRLKSLCSQLDTRVVLVPYLSRQPSAANSATANGNTDNNTSSVADSIINYIEYPAFIAQYCPKHILTDAKAIIDFVPRAFGDPLYIMFSSGTTGKPKCIVHGIGGTLLQHAKEHALQSNLKAKDSILFFTTCGWMMWNWLVSALFAKATVVLYEGNPLYPHAYTLLDLVSRYNVTHFGAGARYYQEIQHVYETQPSTHNNAQDKALNVKYNFSSLKVLFSTGSPLSSESFKFIYEQISSTVQLSSISGGTDIISCFVLGAPILPVYEGEIQALGLGMAVEVFNEQGEPVVQEKGELVCTKAFPSMPIYFFNDAKDELYRQAYFSENPLIWKHGDYAEIVPHFNANEQLVSRGVIIYGRSDTTLNPGGVRIGTAEIYNALETLSEVEESLVVGRNIANDVEIILFVKTRALQQQSLAETALEDDTKQQILHCIRTLCTARHVPQHIFRVGDIPRTVSGKISEKSVKNLMDGKMVSNTEALVNPGCLDEFVAIIAQLQTNTL